MSITKIQELFQSTATIHFNDRGIVRDKILNLAKQLDTPNALAVYLDSDNYVVRLFAVEALGVINNEKSVEYLVSLLEKEQIKEVQQSAIYSLRDITKFSALEALLKIANNAEYSKLVRSLAIQSVAVLALKIVINPLLAILMEATATDNPSLVEDVIDAFEILDNDEQAVIKQLVKLLDSKNVPYYLHLYIIEYLGDRRYEQASNIILQFLDSEESDLRAAAAKALGKIGNSKFIPNLEAKLNDDDDMVQRNVKEALQKLRISN